MSFEPEIVMAYVDGELDLVTAKRIEKAMEGDPALAQRVAAERALKARLAARFDAVLAESVPDRLSAPLANLDTSLAERRSARAGFGIVQWGAVAASLVIGLLVGQTALRDTGPVGARDDGLVAQGSLATALDTQLASAQPASAATRIGLTFRDGKGAVCRTFEGEGLSGIACRTDGDWQLRQTLSGGTGSDYRQASSGALAEAAEAMMAGEAFDARSERAARDKGWR